MKLDDVTSKLESLNSEKTQFSTQVQSMQAERAQMEAKLSKAEKTVNKVKKVKKRALAFATFGLSLAFQGSKDSHNKDHASASEIVPAGPGTGRGTQQPGPAQKLPVAQAIPA